MSILNVNFILFLCPKKIFFYLLCCKKCCQWNYAEAFIEKAEKKSWHPIVWPHPEQCAPEIVQNQKVWWNFFIALFCEINWFMMVNDFDKLSWIFFWAHFYGPHSLWFPSFVKSLYCEDLCGTFVNFWNLLIVLSI